MTGAEAVGVGLGFLAIVAPEFWPKMPRSLSYTLAGIGLSWLTYSLILGIESVSHAKLQYGPLAAIILGAVTIGCGLLWHFSRMHSSIASVSEEHGERPTVAAAPILFNCDISQPPTTIPASGKLLTMALLSRAETGDAMWITDLSSREGDPGSRLIWSDDPGMWRCDITNYADFPIFNVTMNFGQVFYEGNGISPPGMAQNIKSTGDREVTIASIDPKATVRFYAYNESRYFAHVFMPLEVTYVRAGGSAREKAELLPTRVPAMSFWPMKRLFKN